MNKKVYVGATFDLFHYGHVEILRKCADYGEVWVALNTDEFCAEYKRKPVMTYDERKRVLEACKYVTGVVENVGGKDSKLSILQVMPDYIAHGDDWSDEAYLKQTGLTDEFMQEHGMKMLVFPYTKSISTSEIIKRFND